MNNNLSYRLSYRLIFFAAFATVFLFSYGLQAQITAPGSSYSEMTSYPSFPGNDAVFIFCASRGQQIGVLEVTTEMEGEKNYIWEKFNTSTGVFEPWSNEILVDNSARVSGLGNGGYRVTVVSETGQEVHRAWVFNNWHEATAAVTESNCDFFVMSGEITSEELAYYDIATGQKVEIRQEIETEWYNGEVIVSRVEAATIYGPPTKDTNYELLVLDRFGCEKSTIVTYYSIVTRADFTAGPMNGEAPLTVSFSNDSENGDMGYYEWFFFKDLDRIKRESAVSTQPVDSIWFIAYDDNPVYTYESSGTYMVKLVSKKTSEFHVCTDTLYLNTYIVADTSLISAPNVFTPNGDGVNDNFVIKFWSMKEVKITIKNRWGRTLHSYQEKNVKGFDNAWAVSAWDGKVGGFYATPGVYFYIIEGVGRDGKRQYERGFFHLFRGKD